MGEVSTEGLGLDCNPFVLVTEKKTKTKKTALSWTNGTAGTHTHRIVTNTAVRPTLADVASA